MSDLIWKIRQWFRKLVPLLVVGAVSFGGYHLYKSGFFKKGIGSQVSGLATGIAQKIPFFGSKFGRANGSSMSNYSGSKSSLASRHSVSRRKKSRHAKGKRHHGRSRQQRRNHR